MQHEGMAVNFQWLISPFAQFMDSLLEENIFNRRSKRLNEYFSTAVISVWNSLPSALVQAKNASVFKRSCWDGKLRYAPLLLCYE
ncbi:hypothetical protein L596_018638 [Steinernema carpocapsae]|uniref:Uncharacterized protein n=1 Tax=Steinernema carpocapsae TaxID=34508 RepID=A0A4U5N581_STECR|nr:hypothetical protein L596_018638 [Steinernema carpocapsae]